MSNYINYKHTFIHQECVTLKQLNTEMKNNFKNMITEFDILLNYKKVFLKRSDLLNLTFFLIEYINKTLNTKNSIPNFEKQIVTFKKRELKDTIYSLKKRIYQKNTSVKNLIVYQETLELISIELTKYILIDKNNFKRSYKRLSYLIINALKKEQSKEDVLFLTTLSAYLNNIFISSNEDELNRLKLLQEEIKTNLKSSTANSILDNNINKQKVILPQ